MKMRNKIMMFLGAFALSLTPIITVVSCTKANENIQTEQPSAPNIPEQNQNENQPTEQDNQVDGPNSEVDTPISPDQNNNGDLQDGEVTNPEVQPGPVVPPSQPQEDINKPSKPDTEENNQDSSNPQEGETEHGEAPQIVPQPAPGPVVPPQPEVEPQPTPGPVVPQEPEPQPEPEQNLESETLKALKETINGIVIKESVYEWDNVKFKIFTEPGSDQEFATITSIKWQMNDGHGNQIQVPELVGYPNSEGGHTMIPVKAIGGEVFNNEATDRDGFMKNSVYTNKDVWKIYINDNVEYIFDGALAGLNNNNGAQIPFYGGQNLKWIGNGAFYNAGLGSVTIGENWNKLVYIGNYAFCDDWNIRNAKIPQSVEFIGDNAFGKLWRSEVNEISIPNAYKDQLPSIFGIEEGNQFFDKVKLY